LMCEKRDFFFKKRLSGEEMFEFLFLLKYQ